jgi:uroporphyrin-III C-methyltransferase/precorrin-2 dehydrogenase/sirohydrochlorin ferrochelatase
MTGRVVILLGSGAAADAKRRLYSRAGAELTDDPQDRRAQIAVIAIEDEETAAAAARRLKARGLLVNVVDRPDLCDFTTPAIIDRSPLLVAIGSGGASAGLAKALRQRLDALLPAGLGPLSERLFAARPRIAARWSDPSARRRAIDDALSEGGALDPLADLPADSVDQWLERASEAFVGSEIVEILLTSADPDDLTLKQARILGRADTIYAMADVPETVLARARADAVRHVGQALPETLPGGITVLIGMAG